MLELDLESVIDAVVKAEGGELQKQNFFEDRRTLDRRRGHADSLIPRGQCRRANKRRCSLREFSSRPWWLHIEYAIEKPLSRARASLFSVK